MNSTQGFNKMIPLKLQVLQEQFSVHQFAATSQIPEQVFASNFFTISKTADELSVVCDAAIQLNAEKSEDGWSALKVVGPLDFALVGILAELATTLAQAGISIFAISTYDTDYILIKTEQLRLALKTLLTAGYENV